MILLTMCDVGNAALSMLTRRNGIAKMRLWGHEGIDVRKTIMRTSIATQEIEGTKSTQCGNRCRCHRVAKRKRGPDADLCGRKKT